MDALLIPTFLCPKAWESMPGDVAVRFCSYCKKHVHNLEAMSVSERLALLSSPAASICARYKVAIRRPATDAYPTESDESQPVDLKLDPAEVEKLLHQIQLPAPEPMPIVTLKAG